MGYIRGPDIIHISLAKVDYNKFFVRVTMPLMKQFEVMNHYYSVLFHELIHWIKQIIMSASGKYLY